LKFRRDNSCCFEKEIQKRAFIAKKAHLETIADNKRMILQKVTWERMEDKK
jgi:hypothetical protein